MAWKDYNKKSQLMLVNVAAQVCNCCYHLDERRDHFMCYKDLSNNLAAPARRALEANGITNLEQLSSYDEKEIAEWHGIGKNAMEVINLAINEYKSSPKAVL